MTRILYVASLLLIIGAMLLSSQPDAEGCAAVRRLDGPSISIAEESAIIVWDPVKKVQHFIRRAAFDTKSPDFGFLVPTPTLPTLPLVEVEDGIFRQMDKWLLPKTVEQTKWDFQPMVGMFCCLGGFKSSAPMAMKDGVRVLHEQKVGGFETAVLEADNTEDLSNWLKKNGYSNDPELQSWLVPYVGAKWKITAFKISQDPKTGQLATTKAVRMSFKTDRPFFPYREPEGKPEKKAVDSGNGKEKDKYVPTEIDGVWKVESADGGAKDPGSFQFLGTTVWFGEGVGVGRFFKDIQYTVDASKEPKWLDLGKGMKGIYKLDGDTLTWCRGTTVRPGSFDAKEGLLLVLRRGTKAEADAAAAGVAARDLERLHGGGRLLRVLFVSDTRMDGKLGNSDWHAKIPWSDQLTDEQRKQVAKESGVPEDELPAKAWLTTFEDRTSPRPGKEEVYFDPAKDTTPIRPQIIHFNEVWLPLDCLTVGGSLVLLGVFAIAVRVIGKRRS